MKPIFFKTPVFFYQARQEFLFCALATHECCVFLLVDLTNFFFSEGSTATLKSGLGIVWDSQAHYVIISRVTS